MKPILFNTEMVRAILEGRKTVTRRVVKIPSYVKKQEDGLFTLFTEGTCYEDCELEEIQNYLKQPYKANDILYVRETWSYIDFAGENNGYVYKASDNGELWEKESNGWRWKPSIHMPKEAARLFLRVKSVIVDQLNSMTVEDVVAEGVNMDGIVTNRGVIEYRAWHRWYELWESNIKKSELALYGADANPYVWVIEFELLPCSSLAEAEKLEV